MTSSVLRVPFPDEILLESGFSEQGAVEKCSNCLSLTLYAHHQITSGNGAEILGIRKYDFIRLLAEAGVNYFDYTDRELDSEFSVVEQWEGQHG